MNPETQPIRVTLVNNSNQKLRAIVLIKPEKPLEQILTFAKNKLKIKKPARLFVQKDELVYEILTDEAKLASILQNDGIVLISSGEDYVGKLGFCPPDCAVSDPITSAAEVTLLHINSYVEQDAIRQLNQTGKLPGMILCSGMPDLHAGNTYPIGAAFVTEGIVYPALIGGDIGCGMSMYRLNSLSAKDIYGREERIASLITGIEGPWDGNTSAWLSKSSISPTDFDSSLGTVGAGNHFAEIQLVHEIIDSEICSTLGFDSTSAYLLVHSGSRGLGQSVLAKHGKVGLTDGTDEFTHYMKDHDNACAWAVSNRELIAHRIFNALGMEDESQNKILDIWHNNVQKTVLDSREVYLHRKGAAPSDRGLIVIPGSRGTLTYVVVPIGDQQKNAFSVAHGAGREISRTKALAKHKDQYSKKDLVTSLTKNAFGGVVICEDLDLLCEEAPNVYKDVECVVQDLVDRSIVKVVASFKPMVTYKMRAQ